MSKKKTLSQVAKTIKKGTFRKWCANRGLLSADGKVTGKCIQAGLKSKDPTTRRRANLAKTFAKHRPKKADGGQLSSSGSSKAMGGVLAAAQLASLIPGIVDMVTKNNKRNAAIEDRLGSFMTRYADGGVLVEGPTHEEGGVPVTEAGTVSDNGDFEVEGGEVIYPINFGGKMVKYVFSNRLIYRDGKTFADLARDLMSKYKGNDDLKKKTLDYEMKRLAEANEGMRMIKEQVTKGSFAYGGHLRKRRADGGGLDLLNKTPKSSYENADLLRSLLADSSLPEVDAINTKAGMEGTSFSTDDLANLAATHGRLANSLTNPEPDKVSISNDVDMKTKLRGLRQAAKAVSTFFKEKGTPENLTKATALASVGYDLLTALSPARREQPRTNPYASRIQQLLEKRITDNAVRQAIAQQAAAGYIQNAGMRSSGLNMAANQAITAKAMDALSKGILGIEQANMKADQQAAAILSRVGLGDQQALLAMDDRNAANQAQRRNIVRGALTNLNQMMAQQQARDQQLRYITGMTAAMMPKNVGLDMDAYYRFLKGETDQFPTLHYKF